MAQITQERTGWRDEGISRRHRLWGVENQATDIDGLILNEYKNNFGVITPVALIEYKNQHASAKSYNAPQITAMSELGEVPHTVKTNFSPKIS